MIPCCLSPMICMMAQFTMKICTMNSYDVFVPKVRKMAKDDVVYNNHKSM